MLSLPRFPAHIEEYLYLLSEAPNAHDERDQDLFQFADMTSKLSAGQLVSIDKGKSSKISLTTSVPRRPFHTRGYRFNLRLR